MFQKAHLFLAVLGAVLLAISDLAVLEATGKARGFFMDSPPERTEIDPSVLNTTMRHLSLYESSGGKQTKKVDPYGGTSGEFHVSDIARDELRRRGLYREDMSEREEAETFVKMQRNDLIAGGIEFDSLLPREQIASLTFLYNAGTGDYSVKFRDMLGRLSRARAEGAGKSTIDTLVKGTVGFMDVITGTANGKESVLPGLIRRQVSQKSVFQTNTIQFGELVNEARGKQFIREGHNEAMQIYNNLKALDELK